MTSKGWKKPFLPVGWRPRDLLRCSMRCAALVRPLVPAPRPSIAGAVSDLMSVRKPCSLAVPTVVGVSAAISDSATNARINWRCPLPLRKSAFSFQTEFIGTRFLRRKIVGRCCNPVNHRGSAAILEWPGGDGGGMVGCSADHGESKDLPATRWPALDDRLAPNPVAGIGGVAYLAEVSRERAPSTCECAIDRSDALAAHHLGRRVRGLSLLNSGLIPQ